MLKFVPQYDSRGCVVACAAMVMGVSYPTAADRLGFEPHYRGLCPLDIIPWVRMKYHGRWSAFRDKPLEAASLPYSEQILLLSRLYPNGNRHMVLLHDGWEYDPATLGPRVYTGEPHPVVGYITLNDHALVKGLLTTAAAG